MVNHKPIETRFDGYRFRSRLEARWAVFFKTIGLSYEYEKEGFHLDDEMYLPDFWLPQVSLWAEVKPVEFNERELRLAGKLTKATGNRVLMLVGLPDFRSYNEAPTENPDDFTADHIITTTYLHEKRFFSCTGCERNDDPSTVRWLQDDGAYRNAVEAAKSARFEFGEAG
jgi:hypothetical protein